MKNEVNRALVAKKKLFLLFALLTLSVGMWAEDVITYTATASLQELFNNPEKFEPPMSNDYDEETGTGTVTFYNLMEIRNEAFKECAALTSITLPASIQRIEVEAFAGCKNLESITCKASQPPFCHYMAFNDVPENIPLYVPALSVDAYKMADVWGNRFNIQALPIAVGDQFKDETTGLYFEITSLGIPKTVKVAKYGYSNSSYNIPSSVTYSDVEYTVTAIEKDAFYNCWNLTSITLPSTITTIGEDAFSFCVFSSIDLPAALTTIGKYAFSCCKNLQSIIVPANVTTIEYHAFNECTALTSVTFLGNCTIGDNVFFGVGADAPALLTLPNNWTGTKPDEDGNWYGGKFEMSEEPIPGLTTYLDENGEEQEIVATKITSSSDQVTWNAGWYVVKGTDVQLSKGAVCSGAVHLILADGAKLTATGDDDNNTPGIQVSGDGNSLTVYGQADQSGQLIANGGSSAAGIGGGMNGSGSNITINGGNVTANGGEYAAGIGGGSMGSGSNITITGGKVTATGGYIGAGIGGGNNVSGSDINITGGNVTANGGENGFGFGDGEGSPNISVATNLVVKAGDNYPLQEIEDHGYNLRYEITHKRYATIKDPNAKITLTAADFTVTKDGDWKYDQTEKRVKVEISEEYIMPESSNMTIYYNNDKTVKPIDPGTYQVYIDIEETDTYAAVTGITSDAWKFDIIDPEGAIQAIKEKKEEAVQAINSEAGDFETVPIVQEVVEGAKANFEEITITATNTINEATDQSTITTTKDNAISEIDEIVASAKTNIQTAIANFKESEQNEIDNAATATKSEIDAFAVSEKVKDDAKSEIDEAVAEAEETIDNANSKEQIDNAKNNALNKFSIQVAVVEAYYDQLQDAKVVAIQKIEEVAADAEAAIDEAAGEYASLHAIWEIISSKKEEIASRKGEASHFIGVATDMEEISPQKEEAIQHIENIKSSAVEEIQTAIQEFIALQEDAINKVEQEAATAKEEIDGLGVDESAKSEAKAQIDNIVNTAKQTINAATSKDEIDNVKMQAIADIHNVVQTTKDMWVTLRTNVTANDWNTICMERNITAIDGATFWNVVSETDAAFTLEQVEAPFPAGYGYIIRYTATELKVKYGSEIAVSPVTATQDHPIQGRFAEITCDQYGQNELVNNYVVYQNQLCKVTGWVTMADHRAYVVAGKAPSKAPAPNGAPRMTMPKPNSTPTDNSSLHHSINSHTRGASFKMIKDGQFVIIRDNKMYNAQGIEL